jgi:hypothetical protein
MTGDFPPQNSGHPDSGSSRPFLRRPGWRAAAALLALVCVAWGFHFVDTLQQRRYAEQAFSDMNEGWSGETQSLAWAALAAAREDTRFKALEIAFSKPSLEAKLLDHEQVLVRAMTGLDPDGHLSRRFADLICDRLKQGDWKLPRACFPELRFEPAVGVIVDRIRTENNPAALAQFRAALVAMGERLDVADVKLLSATIAERMKAGLNAEAICTLGETMSALRATLGERDLQIAAVALFNAVKTEAGAERRRALAWTLFQIRGKMEGNNREVMDANFAKEMQSEKDATRQSRLSDALGAIKQWASPPQPAKQPANGGSPPQPGNKATPPRDEEDGAALLEQIASAKDANLFCELASRAISNSALRAQAIGPVVAELAGRIGTEGDEEALSQLVGFSEKQEAKNAPPLAAAVFERVKAERDAESLSRLCRGLGALGEKLPPDQIRLMAAAISQRMSREPDTDALCALAETLGTLAAKLKRPDARIAIGAMELRLKQTKDSEAFSKVARVLTELKSSMDAKDANFVVEAIIHRMMAVQFVDPKLFVIDQISSLSGAMDPNVPRTLALEVVDRMKDEKQSLQIWEMDAVLRPLSFTLTSAEIQPAAAALMRVMAAAPGQVLMSPFDADLFMRLEAREVAPLVAILVERMKTEENPAVIIGCGITLGRITEKLNPEEAHPFVAALIARMRKESDPEMVSALGRALSELNGRLRMEDARAALDLLTDTCRRHGGEGFFGRAWVPLEEAADRDESAPVRIQKYVDLLALPLVAFHEDQELIEGLGRLTGQTFGLWGFVDWAQNSKEGKAMRLHLQGSPLPWRRHLSSEPP